MPDRRLLEELLQMAAPEYELSDDEIAFVYVVRQLADALGQHELLAVCAQIELLKLKDENDPISVLKKRHSWIGLPSFTLLRPHAHLGISVLLHNVVHSAPRLTHWGLPAPAYSES